MIRAVTNQIRNLTRQIGVRVCLVVGLALSLPMLARADNGGPLQLESACNIATLAVALLGPIVLTVLWSSCHDARLEESAALSGTPTRRTRAALLTTGFVVLTSWASASVGLTLLMGAGADGDPLAAGVPDQSTAKLIVLAATIVVVAIWIPGLMVGRGTRAGLGLVLALSGFYLAARILGSGPLSILRALLPTTAIEVIDDGREGVAAGLGFAAAVLLAAHLSVAVYRVWAPPIPEKRSPTGRRSRRSPRDVRLAIVLWAVGAAIVGAVVPVAVTDQLPVRFRPSLAMARLNDSAPDQVASTYLLALRTHNDAAQKRLSVMDPWSGSDLAREDFIAGPSGIVQLIAVDGWSEAQVRLTSGSREAVICLVHPRDAWVVRTISSRPCGQP